MIEKLRSTSSGEILRLVLCAFTVAFLIAAIATSGAGDMHKGLGRIVSKPSLLTKDYFFTDIGSVSGALLNVGLVGLVCCAMMFLPGAAGGRGTVARHRGVLLLRDQHPEHLALHSGHLCVFADQEAALRQEHQLRHVLHGPRAAGE